MRTAAILPVKRFAHAKQRLGASVAAALRADLARAMVGDVLLALSETPSIAQTIVVTGAGWGSGRTCSISPRPPGPRPPGTPPTETASTSWLRVDLGKCQ